MWVYHPPLLSTEAVELQSNVAQRHHGRVTGTQQRTGSGVDLSVLWKYSAVRTVFKCTSKLFTGSQKEAVSYVSNKCSNYITIWLNRLHQRDITIFYRADSLTLKWRAGINSMGATIVMVKIHIYKYQINISEIPGSIHIHIVQWLHSQHIWT